MKHFFSKDQKLSSSEQLNLLSIRRYDLSLQVIEPPSEELVEKVRGEFGLNEQRVREAVQHVKDWIQLQPHLPKEIGTFGKDTVKNITLFVEIRT
jgi:hypothetical protein